MALRKVTQRQAQGCGVACVATIAGIEYWEAARLFRSCDLRYDGVQSRHVIAALNSLGIECGKKLVSLHQRDFRTLPFDAIIRTNRRKDGAHFIVWDSSQKIVIDPLRDPYERYRKPQWYLKILGTR